MGTLMSCTIATVVLPTLPPPSSTSQGLEITSRFARKQNTHVSTTYRRRRAPHAHHHSKPSRRGGGGGRRSSPIWGRCRGALRSAISCEGRWRRRACTCRWRAVLNPATNPIFYTAILPSTPKPPPLSPSSRPPPPSSSSTLPSCPLPSSPHLHTPHSPTQFSSSPHCSPAPTSAQPTLPTPQPPPPYQRALISLGAEKLEVLKLSRSSAARRYWVQRSIYQLTRQKGSFKELDATSPPPPPPEGRVEQAVAYELLARVCMTDNKRMHAGYCAMKALNIGLSLPTLHPVVARSYATLCLVESAKASRGTMVRLYKRRAMQVCEEGGEEGGEEGC